MDEVMKRRVAALGVVVALGAGVGVALGVAGSFAEAQEAKVAVKGRITGGEDLTNPVWDEAADPKNNRYTFRMPSPAVPKERRARLSAFLPKEVCIVALADGAKARGTPVPVHVSGGRSTPVTLVIPPEQNVQFINDDPFTHKLYDLKGVQGGLGPEDMKPGAQRTWKPPGPGVFEIRDKYFPSIRTWVVVEPRAAGFGFPKVNGEFTVPDLAPGTYELRAYFSGAAVGKPLSIELRPTPELQEARDPLVVGGGGEPKKDDDKDKEKEKEKEKGGG
jgi:hypothetical protein